MQRDTRSYLWDIANGADAILSFIAGRDAKTYAASDVIHSAVERKFEIIGEALGQLYRQDAAMAARIPNFRAIIAFRNLLIHGYAAVKHERVWQIVTESLPELRICVAQLLDEQPEG